MVSGGFLVQSRMNKIQKSGWVTEKQGDAEMIADLRFAWKVVKHVKSML